MAIDYAEFFQSNIDEIVTDIKNLVESESPSRRPDLLSKCYEIIESIVQKRLSVGVSKIRNPDGNLILHFTVEGKSDLKPVLLLTHYDTVHLEGTINEFPFENKSGILRGPGVFDMKTGIIQGIWALKFLKDHGLVTRPVVFMATPDEEIGTRNSRPAIEDFARESEYVIVLEPSFQGKLKTSRKGTGDFAVKVIGRAAHAGSEPENGINAIEEISRIVLQLQQLNNNDKGTTVNVGTISGGTTTNVVPAEAEVAIDVRVWSQEEADRISDVLSSLKPQNPEAEVIVNGDYDRPPMQSGPKALEMVKIVKKMAGDMGFNLEDTAVGGASDGNLAAALGITVIDGFGAVGDGAHSRSEHAYLKDIPLRTALLSRVLMTF